MSIIYITATDYRKMSEDGSLLNEEGHFKKKVRVEYAKALANINKTFQTVFPKSTIPYKNVLKYVDAIVIPASFIPECSGEPFNFEEHVTLLFQGGSLIVVFDLVPETWFNRKDRLILLKMIVEFLENLETEMGIDNTTVSNVITKLKEDSKEHIIDALIE